MAIRIGTETQQQFQPVSMTQPISIKGIREGLLISLNDAADMGLIDAINSELIEKQGFLDGSRIVLDVGQRTFDRRQLGRFQALFDDYGMSLHAVLTENDETKSQAQDLGLATRIAGSNTDLNGNVVEAVATQATPPSPQSVMPATATSGSPLFIKTNIRSGRSIYHEGDIIVLGDVNPGSEVVAAGNVIIWGRVRGVIHAGALGDETAVICALDLSPTQLRIGSHIAVPPQDNVDPLPETARVRDGMIIAEAWQ